MLTGPITPLLDKARQANVWELRKVGLGLLMSVRSDWKPIPFIEDTAVPPEHLAAYIPQIDAFCRELGTEMTYYAHASSGCLHIRPLINTRLRPEIDKMKAIAEFVAGLLGVYGGALSSEHGDGRVRSWLNEAFYGPELYGLFREVKHIFDPHNLFNPGNIVDAPPIDRDLRQGPGYTTIELRPKLHFGRGMADEIEMCNGAAVCRKLTSGAMCPSFMATRDEEHSTRGRANMLRAAISGRIPATELTSPRMYQVMELCVSCKTCKAECPSSVDMAKLKTEFLGQYYDHHRRPLRDHLFANIDRLSRLGSGWRAPLANRVLAWGLTKTVLDRGLGISRERTLPQFARRPVHWHPASSSTPRAARAQPSVLLFADTYNAYSYPHVAEAACAVLHAAGLRVQVSPLTDCGRPALSKGMIERARRQASRVLDVLEPQARMGIPIVFLEPSDWSAVVDDYAALLPGDRRLAVVAAHCYTFEQYLVYLFDHGELSLRTVQVGQNPSRCCCTPTATRRRWAARRRACARLSLPPGYKVSEIDSSCCGMAGAFGYEAEHYAVSLKMSEHKLADAVRSAPADTLIVAAGVSCRQQIAHVTGRTALHPAEVIWQALRQRRGTWAWRNSPRTEFREKLVSVGRTLCHATCDPEWQCIRQRQPLDREDAFACHDKDAVARDGPHEGGAGKLAKGRQQADLCSKVETGQRDLLAAAAVERYGRVDVPGQRIPVRRDGGAVAPGERAKRPGLVHAAHVPLIRRISRARVMVATHQDKGKVAVTFSPAVNGVQRSRRAAAGGVQEIA